MHAFKLALVYTSTITCYLENERPEQVSTNIKIYSFAVFQLL